MTPLFNGVAGGVAPDVVLRGGVAAILLMKTGAQNVRLKYIGIRSVGCEDAAMTKRKPTLADGSLNN
jgi:hypothetical protein